MPDQEPPLMLGLTQSPAPPEPVNADDLQFRQAEFEPPKPSRACVACAKEIPDAYYHVGGAVTCPACAEQRRTLQGKPRGGALFLKAAFYGAGAALGGALLYWLVSLTGLQFAIIAIVVGVMVGKAIRHVTQGRSSRRY